MAGVGYTQLQPGDPCILLVESPHKPEGWWYGKVVSCTIRNGGGKPTFIMEAVYEQPISVERNIDAIDAATTPPREPLQHYMVFPDDPGTRFLVLGLINLQQLVQQQQRLADRIAAESHKTTKFVIGFHERVTATLLGSMAALAERLKQ